ncbi:uncharacterized protein EV420DRAFT_364161 [Desarmillaria tabescens]|uniref:Uncharacterized protein n=1 Tax=Armillaria tabescens TaxID=1929756 RepID=A0AA39KEM3_ARMTA|nr:uncharacterized protein EV420DRAFT_364161 [Desarmillaria tabescens]KAK0458550.1 hypothetical protein EV420DRAFT_364161 [Desarmillaria tabescens]
MPPKRKQVDETPAEGSSTRATRSSTRASTAKKGGETSNSTSQKSTKKAAAKTTKKATTPKNAADEDQPPAKKARTSNPRATKRGKKSNATYGNLYRQLRGSSSCFFLFVSRFPRYRLALSYSPLSLSHATISTLAFPEKAPRMMSLSCCEFLLSQSFPFTSALSCLGVVVAVGVDAHLCAFYPFFLAALLTTSTPYIATTQPVPVSR